MALDFSCPSSSLRYTTDDEFLFLLTPHDKHYFHIKKGVAVCIYIHLAFYDRMKGTRRVTSSSIIAGGGMIPHKKSSNNNTAAVRPTTRRFPAGLRRPPPQQQQQRRQQQRRRRYLQDAGGGHGRSSLVMILMILSCCFVLLLLPSQITAKMVDISSLLLTSNNNNNNNNNSNDSSQSTSKTTVSVANLQLPPSSRFQKVEGYIHGDSSSTATTGSGGGGGGGYIDISDLSFTISGSSSTTAATTAENEDDNQDIISYVDMALLYIPDRCHETPEGCDLAKDLGIGVPSKSGKSNTWYCCTLDASLDGACSVGTATSTTADFGRLILNPQLFHGETRSITISSNTNGNAVEIRHFVGAEAAFAASHGGGEYALILANCNMAHSRLVVVNGTVAFVSTFAPTDSGGGGDDATFPSHSSQQDGQDQASVINQVQDFALFYPALAIFYLLLLLWFARLLRQHVESRIALEKWIFVTTCMGFCEMTLRAMEFAIWQYNTYRRYKHHDDEMTGQVIPADINNSNTNNNGGASHPVWLALVAVLFGSCKHGIGRSLFLMLALGWGVVRAELRRCTMTVIVGMASVYMICDAAFDLVNYLVSYHGYQISSQLGNLLLIGFILHNVVEVTFTIWIPVALCRTISFLKRTKQDQKLARYRLLLYILAVALGLSTCTILYLVLGPPNGSPMVSLSMGSEVNFFLILLLVAIVWRPNPNAREYAYVMQLSTIDGGAEEEDDGIMLDDLDLSGKSTSTAATVAMHDHGGIAY
jgi:uncharacterized membrane protein YciS (DUF1049 family)